MIVKTSKLKEIEQAEERLTKINKMLKSGKLIDIPESQKKADSGQVKRYEALRDLALEVGGSSISTERQKIANEGELTEGIHRALQTKTMIEVSKIAARNFWIALVASAIALLSMVAAWAAVLVMAYSGIWIR
jgi:hypothetical protein